MTLVSNYSFFPIMDVISVFRFASTYFAGGIDGNIDLIGVTDKGYADENTIKPDTDIPATDNGKYATKWTRSKCLLKTNTLIIIDRKCYKITLTSVRFFCIILNKKLTRYKKRGMITYVNKTCLENMF